MGNEQSFDSGELVQTNMDQSKIVSTGGTVVSGKAKGIIKSEYPVSVKVEGEVYEINIPHNYATNGWLLREASNKYATSFHVEPDVVALRRQDGELLDLGKGVYDSLSQGEEVTAVSTKTAQELGSKWNAKSQSVSRNDLSTLKSQSFDTYSATTYEITVVVGGDTEYTMHLPHLQVSIAWLLSETIRRYMADNDDQDPGILGLQTAEGANLDLSEDAAACLASGDTVYGSSYTVKHKRSSAGTPVVKSKLKQQQDAAMRARLSPRKSVGLDRFIDEAKGFFDEAAARISGKGELLGQQSPPQDSHDEYQSFGRGGFGGSMGRDSGNSSLMDGLPSWNAFKDALGEGTRKVERFKPLRDLVAEIEAATTRERDRISEQRHSSLDRPSNVITYDVETTSDPSGELPRYAQLVIDTVRLAVLDKATNKAVINWRYEEIHGWVIGSATFSVKVVKPWGMQLFDFMAAHPAAISESLLFRVNNLIAQRKHQKQQALLQQQRLAAAEYQDMEDSDSDDDDKDGEETAAEEGEGEAKKKKEKQKVLKAFEVERQIDPSGTLSKHLMLEFTDFQINILDMTTRDVLFEWPYVMVYAWGLSKELFVTAVSVAPPSERFRPEYSEHVKKDKNDLHYLTYAFKTNDTDSMQTMMRHAMDQVQENGAKNTEVLVPKKLEEDRIKEQLQSEWEQQKTYGGTCYKSQSGAEQVFTFEDSNYDKDDHYGDDDDPFEDEEDEEDGGEAAVDAMRQPSPAGKKDSPFDSPASSDDGASAGKEKEKEKEDRFIGMDGMPASPGDDTYIMKSPASSPTNSITAAAATTESPAVPEGELLDLPSLPQPLTATSVLLELEDHTAGELGIDLDQTIAAKIAAAGAAAKAGAAAALTPSATSLDPYATPGQKVESAIASLDPFAPGGSVPAAASETDTAQTATPPQSLNRNDQDQGLLD